MQKCFQYAGLQKIQDQHSTPHRASQQGIPHDSRSSHHPWSTPSNGLHAKHDLNQTHHQQQKFHFFPSFGCPATAQQIPTLMPPLTLAPFTYISFNQTTSTCFPPCKARFFPDTGYRIHPASPSSGYQSPSGRLGKSTQHPHALSFSQQIRGGRFKPQYQPQVGEETLTSSTHTHKKTTRAVDMWFVRLLYPHCHFYYVTET